ncbi:MAG TPA: biotin--[acetyl-CoA-carboxylase] ligase, partial [Bryobacteraceae bacterium]|nr:biotin--[acetyl-CoA-carboxylase] ligase [Bryobacteraceae bacterium]
DGVRARLPGRRIDWFESLDSTMLEARRNLDPGRIVGAEEQTAGMGRHGRKWISEAGTGLYVSIVLAGKAVPIIMLSLGLATREAIGCGDIRWPNDVLLNGRKCAGVLAQVEGDAIIAGIGINVSQTKFPDDLETPATSLLLEGVKSSREDLLVALVEAVDRYTRLNSDEILRQFANASSYVSGKRVRIESGSEGVTCGLDPAGFLRVREDNGTETTILAGGVRPV